VTQDFIALLKLSHHLNDKEMFGWCSGYLSKIIEEVHAVDILVAAHQCHAAELRTQCINYIMEYFEEVVKAETIFDARKNKLSDIIHLSDQVETEVNNWILTFKEKQTKSSTLRCSLCFAGFEKGALSRKNWCKLCNRCVCDKCMTKKYRIPKLFHKIGKLIKTCKRCKQFIQELELEQAKKNKY